MPQNQQSKTPKHLLRRSAIITIILLCIVWLVATGEIEPIITIVATGMMWE